jgi:hypothetical protein
MTIEISPIDSWKKPLPKDQAQMYCLFFEHNGRGWRFPTEEECLTDMRGIPTIVGWCWNKERIASSDYDTAICDVILDRDVKNA